MDVWPDAFRMTMFGDEANAKACEKDCHGGIPDVITSDRGSQFISDLWIEICRLIGIARNATTSYHPQLNAKIERVHRYLKKTRCVLDFWEFQTSWQCYGGYR